MPEQDFFENQSEEVRIFANNIKNNCIKYLKKHCKDIKDPVVHNHCFDLAIKYGKNDEILRLLRNRFKIYPHDTRFLETACQYTDCTKIIDYLVNEMLFDIYDHDCLSMAFKYNIVAVIRHLVNEYKINGEIYFFLACEYNTLSVVKYLINECKVNIGHTNTSGYNALSYAAMNQHIDVIKYLIEVVGMNTYNCLFVSCNCGNFEIIKYLLEDVNMDIEETNIRYCNLCAITKSRDIFIYLLLYTNTSIAVGNTEMFMSSIIELSTNPPVINKILRYESRYFGYSFMLYLLSQINPLLLEKDILNYYEINPFNDSFRSFIKYVDSACGLSNQLSV